jgi:hypothetical protein
VEVGSATLPCEVIAAEIFHPFAVNQRVRPNQRHREFPPFGSGVRSQSSAFGSRPLPLGFEAESPARTAPAAVTLCREWFRGGRRLPGLPSPARPLTRTATAFRGGRESSPIRTLFIKLARESREESPVVVSRSRLD